MMVINTALMSGADDICSFLLSLYCDGVILGRVWRVRVCVGDIGPMNHFMFWKEHTKD